MCCLGEGVEGWGVSERREGFAEPCAVLVKGWEGVRGKEGVGSG